MSDRRIVWGDLLGYLGVGIVALLYIGTAMFAPTASGKTLGSIIADGALGFVLGVSINFNLNMQGVLKGRNDPRMISTRTEHGKAVERISPYLHRLDGWCEQRNAEILKRERTRLLMAVGLRYEDCFDADGTPREVELVGEEKLVKARKKALRAAVRVKLHRLSTASLTTDGERQGDPFDFGESPEQYQRRTNLTGAASKVIMALVFGYYGVTMVSDFRFEELAWRALYVAILVALGIAKLLQSYLFMVDTYRGGVIKKINYLQSFENWASATPESEDEHGKRKSDSVQNGAGENAGGAKGQAAGAGGP
jgi:hypothetical protein